MLGQVADTDEDGKDSVLDSQTPVWLVNFTYNSSGITMDGYSLTNPDLADFVKRLEKSPFYQEVDLAYSNKEKKGEREIFRFSLRAKPEEPAQEPQGG